MYIIYRLPFRDDGKWKSAGNADDPSRHGHGAAQYYSFDFRHNPEGAEVLAARGGTVIFVENNQTCNTYNLPTGDPCEGKPGYGNAVLIRHLDNTVAAYNHMQKGSIPVVKGNWVAQGQKIGLSGNTGYSSEPHLHFGICAYWNSKDDMGPGFPTIFQDKNHLAWRPHVGDVLHSDNDYKRQEQWKWCSKCHGLFSAGNPGSVCPAGPGGHSKTGSGNYVLYKARFNPVQGDWHKCSKCRVLFYGGGPGSKCPKGNGVHDKTGSKQYYITIDTIEYPGNSEFRRCDKCKALWWTGPTTSKCPVGSGGHSKSQTGHVYYLVSYNSSTPFPLPTPDQGGWTVCEKCMSLYYVKELPKTAECLSSGGKHSTFFGDDTFCVLISDK